MYYITRIIKDNQILEVSVVKSKKANGKLFVESASKSCNSATHYLNLENTRTKIKPCSRSTYYRWKKKFKENYV